MAAVRYTWMFRAAAFVYLLFGGFAIWRYGLTDFDPTNRPWGVGFGVFAALIGIFLFRGARLAITLSAIAAALVAICATLGVPMVNGPVILLFALVAVVAGAYAVMAARVLLPGDRGEPPTG